jgi:hypothetical protein
MRRLLPIVFLSSTLVASAWAQSTASPKLLVIAPVRDGPSSSSVAFIRRADFVTFDVTITSTESELPNRVKAIAETTALLTDALAKERVRFDTGTRTYLVLDPPEEGKTPGLLSSGLSSSTSSSAAWTLPKFGRSNEAALHVWVPLADSGDNLLEAASRVAVGLNKLKLPPRVALRYSPFRLAVENPERHRKELLARISEQVGTIKQTMRTTKVSVSGLASPVQIRQVNDTEIEVSLPCAISAELQ